MAREEDQVPPYDNGGILMPGLTTPDLATLLADSDECVVMAIGELRRAEPVPLNLGATHYCIRSGHAGRDCVNGVDLGLMTDDEQDEPHHPNGSP